MEEVNCYSNKLCKYIYNIEIVNSKVFLHKKHSVSKFLL